MFPEEIKRHLCGVIKKAIEKPQKVLRNASSD